MNCFNLRPPIAKQIFLMAIITLIINLIILAFSIYAFQRVKSNLDKARKACQTIINERMSGGD